MTNLLLGALLLVTLLVWRELAALRRESQARGDLILPILDRLAAVEAAIKDLRPGPASREGVRGEG